LEKHAMNLTPAQARALADKVWPIVAELAERGDRGQGEAMLGDFYNWLGELAYPEEAKALCAKRLPSEMEGGNVIVLDERRPTAR
jgi:hypothetical protein